MFEGLFSRKKEIDPCEQYSPYVYNDDFDAKAFRDMEDVYIRLGHMKEEDRMPIPLEIEFPEQASDI